MKCFVNGGARQVVEEAGEPTADRGKSPVEPSTASAAISTNQIPAVAAGSSINAMSVDVEEHFQVSAFESSIRRDDWDQMPSRVMASTRRLLDLFAETDQKATFFVLGWVGQRHPALVREVGERGHEIACHGYSHRRVYDQTPEQFARELSRSRMMLQDLSGQPVEGHRAASFSIDGRNRWALDVVAEAGFRYDSSLLAVERRRPGISGAIRGIHLVSTRSGHRLIEVPPSIVRLAGCSLRLGGGYLRLCPVTFTHWAIRRLNRREGIPAVIYVHPWEIDPQQPRMQGPYLSRFRHYVNLSTTFHKLRSLISRHRFGTMREVIEHAGELPEVAIP